MNDDLRDRLTGAVPEPPDSARWAEQARERSRATRARRNVAGVTAGLLVIGLVGALLWPSFNEGRVAVPANGPSATQLPMTNPDCTGGLRGDPTLRPLAGGDGVVRASLCPMTTGPTFNTPGDSLTDDPSGFYGAVAKLPAVQPRDPDCSDSDDRRYLVVFTMADGSRRTLEAATPNACGVDPTDANGRRWGGLLSAVQKAWAAQRATRTAPVVAAGCAPFDRPALLRPDVAQLVSARLCLSDPDTGAARGSTGLTAEQLAVLRADLTANTSIATNIDSMRDGAVLMVAGPWGDQLVFWRVDGEQWFAFDPDAERGQLFWQPGPVAAETVKLLLAELESAGTPPFSACPSGTGPATRSC